MEIIRKLPGSLKPWREASLWLAWGVLGGLLPLWGTALLLWLFGKPLALFELLKNGEFVLYAASFIAGSMYTIRRDVFPSKNLLTILFSTLLAVSFVVFAAISVRAMPQTAIPPLIEEHLTSASVTVFILTTIFCFLVTLAEAGGAGTDVPDAMKRDSKVLGESFDLLLKAQAANAKE